MDKEVVLTIDIGGSKMRFQFVDKDGNYEAGPIISLTGRTLDNKSFIKLIREGMDKLGSTDKKSNIVAISIAVPGKISPQEKLIEFLPNIKGVENLDLQKELGDEFGLPLFLLNDANAGTLGEYWFGSGKDLKNMIYITLGTGVGSGVIKNGQLEPDHELGHKHLHINNKSYECSCGRFNCAESFLNTNGLARIYAEIFDNNFEDMRIEQKNELSPMMREGVENKDPKWLALQDQYSKYLAQFIRDIWEDLNPEIVILGGGIAFANKDLAKKLQENLGLDIKIDLAKNENAVNLGLGRYAFESL